MTNARNNGLVPIILTTTGEYYPFFQTLFQCMWCDDNVIISKSMIPYILHTSQPVKAQGQQQEQGQEQRRTLQQRTTTTT
eukprot:m.32817 g.32817  ORF g.32817 m.32817 type:complete len:80 (-) comp6412_c0_seq1:9-248(-)